MFKMYRQKAQFASIKYNGNNVEEIKEFLSCINDYILQDLKDRKILIKYVLLFPRMLKGIYYRLACNVLLKLSS